MGHDQRGAHCFGAGTALHALDHFHQDCGSFIHVNGNAINASSIAQVFLLVSLVYAVYRYIVEERRRQAAIEQEFKNARELQQVLVPEALPSLPGFAITSAYRPAQEVGGDFFQIIPLEGGSTLVILGDVSGKGLKAAMAVSLIVGAARMVAEFTSSPAEILAGLNRRLDGRLQGGFATCIAMRLDPDGNCTIASAGHPAPFLNKRELTAARCAAAGPYARLTLRGDDRPAGDRRPLCPLHRWVAGSAQSVWRTLWI
jgi:hypothetical protein